MVEQRNGDGPTRVRPERPERPERGRAGAARGGAARGGQDRFGLAVRQVAQKAVEIANERGSDAVESEHVLLAMTEDPTSPVALFLADIDLDHASLLRALDAERAASLAAIGLTQAPAIVATARPPRNRASWGASIKEAMRRGMGNGSGHGRRGQHPELDVLAGILLADVGTVPRMLTLAGVDRDALLGRVQRERRNDR